MTHVQLVKYGVRLVALEMVRNEQVKACKDILEKEKMLYILNPRGENHTSIYIFNYPCMKNVINFTLGKPYKKTALTQWIEGKMFGYSDEEINRFMDGCVP